jgi:hypothetical protein
LNGSNTDGRCGHRNAGGTSERSAARIVLRANPVRRASSLIDTPRTKCSRRSSAQRSTSSNAFLLASVDNTRPGSTRPRTPPPPPRGSNLNRRRGVSFSPAPTAGGQNDAIFAAIEIQADGDLIWIAARPGNRISPT